MQKIINRITRAIKSRHTESIILQRNNLSYLVPTDKPEYIENIEMLLRFTLSNFDTSKDPLDFFFEDDDLYVLFDSRRDEFAEA